MANAISSLQDERNDMGDGRDVRAATARGNELIIERTGAPCRACRQGLGSRLSRRSTRGFTLIELMLVVAVAGVLSGVAYPSFMGQLQKIRRADALVSILQIQAAQERYRANNVAYGTLAEIGAAATSSAGHYVLQVTEPSATGYEVVASAIGAQAHDTPCRNLRLRIEGGNLVQASGADAATNNPPAQNRQCWMA
jgi:type IV pilus assembly protein PilE